MPVTVGSQTNVPNSGDPITSPWPQDTATKIVHRFVNSAARDAWTTPPEGAMAVTTDTDTLWQRIGSTWVEIPTLVRTGALYVDVAGDTMSGALTVGADPLAGLQGSHVGLTALACSRIANAGVNLQLFKGGTAFATGQHFAAFYGQTTSTVLGTITQASASTVAYNTSSDPRLKERTGDVDDAAELVRQLGATAYRGVWIADDGDGEEWVFVNSTDVAAVAPFAVHGEADAVDDDGNIIPQTVDYNALVPVLLAAVSQLAARVAALEGAS